MLKITNGGNFEMGSRFHRFQHARLGNNTKFHLLVTICDSDIECFVTKDWDRVTPC